MEQRWKDIQAIWRSNQFLYGVAGFLAGILVFPAIEALSQNASGFLSSFVPEAVGIAFTVLLIDRIYRSVEGDKEKRRLILQMGSADNALSIQAIRELSMLEHIDDGSLRNRYFTGSNMEGAVLLNADMQGVHMVGVNLCDASLAHANLKNSNIAFCDFTDARLWNAELNNAALTNINFENVELFGADLRNTFMPDANLRGAVFLPYHPFDRFYGDAVLDETTLLPDESHYQPELGLEQLLRFTDPNHPEFWQPEWVKKKEAKE